MDWWTWNRRVRPIDAAIPLKPDISVNLLKVGKVRGAAIVPRFARLKVSDDRYEPNPEVRISRCARSQNEIRRDRILFSAATRRENQPFIYGAARRRTRIYRLRTFLPSVSQEAMIAVSKQEILGQELLVGAVQAVTVSERSSQPRVCNRRCRKRTLTIGSIAAPSFRVLRLILGLTIRSRGHVRNGPSVLYPVRCSIQGCSTARMRSG